MSVRPPCCSARTHRVRCWQRPAAHTYFKSTSPAGGFTRVSSVRLPSVRVPVIEDKEAKWPSRRATSKSLCKQSI
jgi:hypothetical protein